MVRAPTRDFSRAEIERRVIALQRAMSEADMAAILVADQANVRYFTGYFSETWLNLSRPCACWIPRDGGPLLVICETDEPWARATSWWSEIHSYSGPVVGPNLVLDAPEIDFGQAVADALVGSARTFRLSAGQVVGVPLSGRTRVDLPLGALDALRAATDWTWADASAAIWEVRAVKSPAEIEAIRDAVVALDRAMPEAIAKVGEGVTELEVAQRLREQLFVGGAEHVGYTNVVCDVRQPLFSAPSDRTFQPGEMFYIDGGAVVRGYWSDYCRIGVLGDATAEQERAYVLLVEALAAGQAAVSAGATAGSVARAMLDVLRAVSGEGTIGRMGHGNGAQMPEPPSIHVEDQTQLRTGMVLCLEPNAFINGVGTVVVEDMVVVDDGGCQPLSTRPTPAELPHV